MSKQSPQHEEDFGLIFIDPAVQRSFDQMHEFQIELDQTPNTPKARVDEMIEELDGGWIHLNEYVQVSGIIDTPHVDIEEGVTESGEPAFKLTSSSFTNIAESGCRHRVLDQSFVSRGFDVDKERFVIDGYDLGVRHVLRLMFSRHVFLHTPHQKEPIIGILPSRANIEDITINFAHDSPEYAALKAHEYFKDSTRELEDAISLYGRPADKLMALKGIDIAYDDHITDDEATVLQAHLNELVAIHDDNMPYIVQLEEGTTIYNANPSELLSAEGYFENESAHIMVVQAVQVLPKVAATHLNGGISVENVPDLLELRLVVQLIGDDPEGDSDIVAIRLNEVKDMSSIRQGLVYDDKDELEN